MGAFTDAPASGPRFQESSRVLVLADLAGFTRAVAHLSAVAIAEVVDEFYTRCDELVAGYGGHVVKFSGDNCLAVFEPSDARDAVACVLAMRDSVRSMGEDLHLALDLGANVHIATVVSGRFGGPSTPSDDVIGAGVIHTYRMGSGAGIRISEPVYRKLPSAERGSWRKYQPPATYTLET